MPFGFPLANDGSTARMLRHDGSASDVELPLSYNWCIIDQLLYSSHRDIQHCSHYLDAEWKVCIEGTNIRRWPELDAPILETKAVGSIISGWKVWGEGRGDNAGRNKATTREEVWVRLAPSDVKIIDVLGQDCDLGFVRIYGARSGVTVLEKCPVRRGRDSGWRCSCGARSVAQVEVKTLAGEYMLAPTVVSAPVRMIDIFRSIHKKLPKAKFEFRDEAQAARLEQQQHRLEALSPKAPIIKLFMMDAEGNLVEVFYNQTVCKSWGHSV